MLTEWNPFSIIYLLRTPNCQRGIFPTILFLMDVHICFIYKYVKCILLYLLCIKMHNKIDSYIVPNHLFWERIFLICRDILRILRGKYSFVWKCRFWSFCRMKRVCYALYIVYRLVVTCCFSSNEISEVMASYPFCIVDNFHISIESGLVP